MKYCAPHIRTAVNHVIRAETVREMKKKIEDSGVQYDAIAVCGVSGISVGSILSYLLGKPMLIVRKKDDKCHSSFRVEMNIQFHSRELVNYIIVDDLMDSGSTVDYIYKTIKNSENKRRKTYFNWGDYTKHNFALKGIFLYEQDVDSSDYPTIKSKKERWPALKNVPLKDVVLSGYTNYSF